MRGEKVPHVSIESDHDAKVGALHTHTLAHTHTRSGYGGLTIVACSFVASLAEWRLHDGIKQALIRGRAMR